MKQNKVATTWLAESFRTSKPRTPPSNEKFVFQLNLTIQNSVAF